MSFLKKIDRHATLVNRMGERLNTPLGQALSQDQISPDAYRTAVIRCCACPQADACEHDSATGGSQQPAEQASSAPDYCRNKSLFSGLMGQS